MKRFAGIMIAVTGLLLAAAPAQAQQFTPGQATFYTSDAPAPPRQGSTPIEFRGQAGLWFCCDEVGFIVGAAVGARPFNNRQVEIVGDVSFLRFFGDNGAYISANGLYHFNTNEPNFKPYAGAGLAIINIFDDTEARFQILGGVELRGATKNPIRPELRIIFTEGDVTTVLMVSVGLGKR